jgi:hypothetical protein
VIAIRYIGSQGQVDEVDDDVVRWFHQMLPIPGDDAYPILANIDPGVTTSFDSQQMAAFLTEWRRLQDSGWKRPWLLTDGRDWEHARVMSVIRTVAERCTREPGSSVVFVGD